MKLLKTKDMPRLGKYDLSYAEDFLLDMLKENKGKEFTTKYFSADVIDYLTKRRNIITHTRINGPPTVNEIALSRIEGFNIDVNRADCKVTVSIYTNKSALSEIKMFLIGALNTTSKLNEVKGKYQHLSNNYLYKLELDLHDGAYDSYGKIPSSGILRLITLVDVLLRNMEKK